MGPRLVAAVRNSHCASSRRGLALAYRRLPDGLYGQLAAAGRPILEGVAMRTVDVTDELQAYLDGLVPERDKVLSRLEEEAHREGIPIVDPHEGQLLYLLIKIGGAKRILEL